MTARSPRASASPGTDCRASDSSAAAAMCSSAISSDPSAMAARPTTVRAVWRNGLSSPMPSSPRRASDRSAAMPAGDMEPRSSAIHASLLAPSGIGPDSSERSAVASHFFASRVRPSIAWTQPAMMARAARPSPWPSWSNHPSQRPMVAMRPDQCIGKVNAMTSCATRSMSPARCAYSTAFSGSSCWTHQAAARAQISAVTAGSRTSISSRRRSRNSR